MRPIDADAVMDYICGSIEAMTKVGIAVDGEYLWGLINHAIDDAPTVDAVEVVRCGKCDWWNSETKGCKRNPSVKPWWEDDYCSYGERRTE